MGREINEAIFMILFWMVFGVGVDEERHMVNEYITNMSFVMRVFHFYWCLFVKH